MLDAMLELVVEVVLEFISQLLIEIGFEWIAECFHRRATLSTVLAFIAIPLFGGFIGLILSNTFPQRIVPGPTVPGISLLLSPLATGMVMKLFGDWAEAAASNLLCSQLFGEVRYSPFPWLWYGG